MGLFCVTGLQCNNKAGLSCSSKGWTNPPSPFPHGCSQLEVKPWQEEHPQFITSVNTISATQDWFSSSWNSLPTPRRHFLKRFAHYNLPPQEPPAFIYLIAFFETALSQNPALGTWQFLSQSSRVKTVTSQIFKSEPIPIGSHQSTRVPKLWLCWNTHNQTSSSLLGFCSKEKQIIFFLIFWPSNSRSFSDLKILLHATDRISQGTQTEIDSSPCFEGYQQMEEFGLYWT